MSDLNAMLLQMLTTSGQGTSLQDAVLSQLGGDDPTTALIAQLMAQRQAPSPVEEEEDSAAAIAQAEAERQERERAQAMNKALRHLRGKIDDLYSELEELRVQNDSLAAALGACYLCWGKDSQCEVCQGNGQPGSQVPDQTLFVQLIAPAIRRLQQARQVAVAAPAPATALNHSQR